jgi:thioredoxin 1
MAQTVTDLTDADFDRFIAASTLPVVVDFWAEWCTPCLALEPVLHDLADDLGGQIAVARINVVEQPETAAALGVVSLPTLVLYRDQEIVKRLFGAKTKRQLLVELRATALIPEAPQAAH